MRISPDVADSKPAMMRNRVVLPEPLSPRMVRNSPSATCREMSRSTAFFPNDLATLRMSSRGAVELEVADVVSSLVVANPGSPLGFLIFDSNSPALSFQKTERRGPGTRYCAAFTSFQISLYLARRSTFCQK